MSESVVVILVLTAVVLLEVNSSELSFVVEIFAVTSDN